jgi:hypothetical protein
VDLIAGDIITTANLKLKSLRIMDCLWHSGMNKSFEYLATSEVSDSSDLIQISYEAVNKVFATT